MRKGGDDTLGNFLEQASGLGSLDSQGSFTLAGEAAIGKLASFQLPRKSMWVLKIVQAAVAAEATSIVVKQTAETTTFRFDVKDAFSLEKVQEALLSPQAPAHGPVEHLCVGLRAVGFGDKRAFTLALTHDGERHLFGWNGGELSRQTVKVESPGEAPEIQLGVAFPAEDQGRTLGGLARAAGRATEEYQELLAGCQVSPVPLRIDGRRVDTLAHNEAALTYSSVPLAVSLAPPRSLADAPLIPLPAGMSRGEHGWQFSDRFTDGRLFFFDGGLEQTETTAIFRLTYSFRIISHGGKNSSFRFHSVDRPCRVQWVRDGVICESRPLGFSHPVSVDIYLSGEGLPTDLSGLRIRPGKEADRPQQALRMLEDICSRTQTQLDQYVPRPFGAHTLFAGALGVFGAVAAPATMGKGLLITAAAASLLSSANDKRKIMQDCALHLRSLPRKAPPVGR